MSYKSSISGHVLHLWRARNWPMVLLNKKRAAKSAHKVTQFFYIHGCVDQNGVCFSDAMKTGTRDGHGIPLLSPFPFVLVFNGRVRPSIYMLNFQM